jgi:hypothetical protein
MIGFNKSVPKQGSEMCFCPSLATYKAAIDTWFEGDRDAASKPGEDYAKAYEVS